MLAISAILLFFYFSFHPDACYFCYFAILLFFILVFTQMLAISAILLFSIFYFGFHPDACYFFYFAIFNITEMLAISAIMLFWFSL